MHDTLLRCLEDLEERIDPQQETALHQQWRDFLEGRRREGVFGPRRNQPSPPKVEWPRISVNSALEDYDAMALQQFGAASRALEVGAGSVLNVRCNYGSSIVPLLFGVKPFLMDESLDTLPTSEPLNDLEAIQRLLDEGIPDLNTGYGERVFDMAHRFDEIASEYPKIRQYVQIYHPDLQGPMDICEVVWGSTVYLALFERPRLVHKFLDLVTETYAAFLRAWTAIVPFRQGYNAHWGYLYPGNIMLRDDSAMNLSPAMFDEFVRPYDQRLLDEFGGGAIHFCGHGDHYMPSMTDMAGVHAIHMSQPEYNDMEAMFRSTVDRGINLLGLRRDAAKAALASGRPLCGRVHCDDLVA